MKERDGTWNGKLAGYYHNKVNAQPYSKQTAPFLGFLGYRHCAGVIAEPNQEKNFNELSVMLCGIVSDVTLVTWACCWSLD